MSDSSPAETSGKQLGLPPGLVVFDHRADEFATLRKMGRIEGLRLGMADETLLSARERYGFLKNCDDYWILGRSGEAPAPRWSVIRDVFGWVK